MKIQKNKTGTIFLITMLALAGIGISYAGWTDTIHITGSADTGTVDWDVIEYSGTWVYKVEDHGYERLENQYDGSGVVVPTPTGTPIGGHDGNDWVAAAWAEPGTEDDTVLVTYENIYPGTVFKADIIVEYKGTIPGRINSINPVDPLPDTIDDHTTLDVGVYQKDDQGNYNWRDISQDALLGLQLHQGDKIHVIMNILLPQDNTLMNLGGSFEYEVEIVQWSEYPDDGDGECGDDVDLTITKTVDETHPYVGNEVTFTLTATNNGPDTAKDVQVVDAIPDGFLLYSVSQSKGLINTAYGESVWDIGDMAAGDVETANLTGMIQNLGTYSENTQLCMIIDGSGSINDDEWKLMLDGINASVRDPTICPHDGTVELSIIQFASNIANYAQVDLAPVVITDANYDSVADDILLITQAEGATPLYAGIDLAKTTVEGSSNHPSQGGDFERQVFNIVTDGVPNIGDAEASRDALVATLNEGEDELDAEGVGITQANINWLRDEIVWPVDPITGTGYIAPPFDKGPGWVRAVADYNEFKDTLGEKFQLILQSIVNCAEIVSRENDLYPDDNIDCVTIYPQPCTDPEFTQLNLRYKFDSHTWYQVTGGYNTYTQTLNTDYDYCYLDAIDADVTTNIELAENMYPFYLDTSSVPAGYYDYWDAKGVNAGATDGTWQATMWEIINGNLPMLYYRYDSAESDVHYLVDGLQYQTGQGELPLRISTDYPIGTYTFTGDIESECGSTNTITIDIEFILPLNLFFSEYVEGSANNKALEIYNAGASQIDLSNAQINIYSNGYPGSTPSETITLNSFLPNPSDVFVIGNSGAESNLQSYCDQLDGGLTFNGDDTVELVLNSEIVDVIGQRGVDPGAYWGSGDCKTQDRTLQRKCSVTVGDNDNSDVFDPTIEWNDFTQDYFAGLGNHCNT